MLCITYRYFRTTKRWRWARIKADWHAEKQYLAWAKDFCWSRCRVLQKGFEPHDQVLHWLRQFIHIDECHKAMASTYLLKVCGMYWDTVAWLYFGSPLIYDNLSYEVVHQNWLYLGMFYGCYKFLAIAFRYFCHISNLT